MKKSSKDSQLPLFFNQKPCPNFKNDSKGKIISLCEARRVNEKATMKRQEESVIDKIVTLSSKYSW